MAKPAVRHLLIIVSIVLALALSAQYVLYERSNAALLRRIHNGEFSSPSEYARAVIKTNEFKELHEKLLAIKFQGSLGSGFPASVEVKPSPISARDRKYMEERMTKLSIREVTAPAKCYYGEGGDIEYVMEEPSRGIRFFPTFKAILFDAKHLPDPNAELLRDRFYLYDNV